MGREGGKKAERKEKAEKVRMQRRRCEKVQRRRRGKEREWKKRARQETAGETGKSGRDRTAEEDSGRNGETKSLWDWMIR